jgi:RNA polymerase sigma-70 factor (ECF subfamily)
LLARIIAGDAAASHELLPLVYGQLCALAGSYFRGPPADHTLQATVLAHEAYLKLVQVPDSNWENRVHFCAVAATAPTVPQAPLAEHPIRGTAGPRISNKSL